MPTYASAAAILARDGLLSLYSITKQQGIIYTTKQGLTVDAKDCGDDVGCDCHWNAEH